MWIWIMYSKIIGVPLNDLNSAWEKRIPQKAKATTSQDHVLHGEFSIMLSATSEQDKSPHKIICSLSYESATWSEFNIGFS